jgi:PAS domain S-box-containing protein
LQLLERFAASVGDYAIVLMDAQGHFVYWNQGAELVLGYSAEEAIGQHMSILFTQEDRAAGMPEQELHVAAENGRAEDERWHIRKGGGRFWSLGVVCPVRDSSGTVIGYGKIFRDRTDIKEVQDALRNRAAELARTDEAKNTFLATLAHELRSPLSVLTNSVALLRSKEAPRHLETLADMIDRQVRHTRRIVDDLMDISRIGRQKLQIQVRPVDVCRVMQEACEMVQPQMDEKRHKLVTDGRPSPLVVSGDHDRLVQVFVNILSNAARYTPEGGLITVVMTAEAEEGVVRVTDNGIGIAPEKLTAIFELFTQASATSEGSRYGLGIGLALSRDLVALHGGTIQARSQGVGRGSEFIVRLPLMKGATGIAGRG